MIPFDEIDEEKIGCCRLTEQATKEETFKEIFSKIKRFEIKTNHDANLEFNFEFISQSDKRHLGDRETYLLKLVYDPLAEKIIEEQTEHMTCPDYNINRGCQSDCWHIVLSRRVIELYK